MQTTAAVPASEEVRGAVRRRLGRLLLWFSLGLNVAFVALAVVRARELSSAGPALQRVDFSSRWQGQRAMLLDRALRLDRVQRDVVREHLGAMRPELQAARRDLFQARNDFRAALRRNDAAGTRQTRARLSRAQVHLDSLSAEAMLAEIAVLRPEQRERYLRWTLDRPRFLSRRAHRPPPAEE